MAQLLDVPWLDQQADDRETRGRVREIAEWQRRAFEHSELPADRAHIVLRLGGLELWVEACGSFCALELYQEIFRHDGHCAAPGFDARRARTVVDLGANHGFYALRLKQRNPECHVLCVEPNPYVFPLLKRNVEANALSHVALDPRAVAGANGPIEFDLIRQIHAIAGRALRGVPRAWMREELIQQVQVEAATLPTILDDHGIDEIDILKVDIEGAELAILESAGRALTRIRRIVVERHSRELRDAVRALLAGAGFELVLEEDPECRQYFADMYFARREPPEGPGQ